MSNTVVASTHTTSDENDGSVVGAAAFLTSFSEVPVLTGVQPSVAPRIVGMLPTPPAVRIVTSFPAGSPFAKSDETSRTAEVSATEKRPAQVNCDAPAGSTSVAPAFSTRFEQGKDAAPVNAPARFSVAPAPEPMIVEPGSIVQFLSVRSPT